MDLPQNIFPKWNLRILQIGWAAACLLVLAILLAGIPARYENLSTVSAGLETGIGDLTVLDAQALETLGLSVSFYAGYFTLFESGVILAFLGISVLIFAARRNNLMAVYTALFLVLFGVNASPMIDALGLLRPDWLVLVTITRLSGMIVLIIFLFIFPSGRFFPRWTRYLAVVWVLYNLLWPIGLFRQPVIRIVLQTPAERNGFLWLALWLIFGVLLQIYRYRFHSNTTEKMQTQWIVAGFGFSVVVGAVVSTPVLWVRAQQGSGTLLVALEMIAFTAIIVSELLLAVTFAMAVLRYRLFDIQVIVRRTLIYSTLSALLVLIYFGSVVFLQSLVNFLGGGSQSTLAIVLSTLLIAAVFNPLRQRLQDFIDRRFYRAKYDAEQALTSFSQTMRNEVDLENLSLALVDVVGDTMQPESVSVWLREVAE